MTEPGQDPEEQKPDLKDLQPSEEESAELKGGAGHSPVAGFSHPTL